MAIPQWQTITPNFSGSNQAMSNAQRGISSAVDTISNMQDRFAKEKQVEQARQDALAQQALDNTRADAQLQLSQNQDTRAAEKSAQDTEEFGIKKNTQKQVADYTQQAQGAQVGGLTTAQGLDLSNKFDAMLANGMSGEQAAAATQSASEAVMASNLKDPRMGAQFLAEIKQRSFGDVDSAKLSDLQRVTAQPFEKKIETDEQRAFQAEQDRLSREQSASQFNKTYAAQQELLRIANQERDEKRAATLAMSSDGSININPEAADYQINTVPKNIEEAYSRLGAGTATDSDKSNIAKYEKITTEFIAKATATRASTTLESLAKAKKDNPDNVEIANQYNQQKAANELAIAKLKADLTKQNNELALSADKSTGGNSSGTDKAASIDTIYKGMGIDAKTATKEDKQIASQILATGATEKQVGDITGAEGFRSEGGWLSNASYSADLSDKLAAIKTANTRTPGAGAELQKAIANTESQIEALQPPKSDKELVSKYESSVNALGVEKADNGKSGDISGGSGKTTLQRNVAAEKDSSELTIEQLSNPTTLTDAQFKVAVEFANTPAPLLSNHIADSKVKAAIRTEAAKRKNIAHMKAKDTEIARIKNEIASTKSHSKLEQLNADLLVAQGRRALGL